MQCSHPAKKRQAGRAVGHPELSQQLSSNPVLLSGQQGSWVPPGEYWPEAHTNCRQNRLRSSVLATFSVPMDAPATGYSAQVTVTVLRIGHGAWVRPNRDPNRDFPASCLGALAASHLPWDAFRLLPSAFGPSCMVQCPEFSHRPTPLSVPTPVCPC